MTLSLSLKNEKILSLFAGVRKCLAHTSEREGKSFGLVSLSSTLLLRLLLSLV